MIYAGIGSRRTPEPVCKYMTHVATELGGAGYQLRSGGAGGADYAFALGAFSASDIIYPREATASAIHLASHYHPNWDSVVRLNAEPYHGRNVMIILGRDLETPVKFVVCWTQGGRLEGGTALGIRVATNYGIPVYNLGDYNNKLKLDQFLKDLNA